MEALPNWVGLTLHGEVGIVLGGIVVGTWGGFRRRIITTIFGWIVYGIGTVCVGIAPVDFLAFAIAGITLSGVGSSLINAPLRALLQAMLISMYKAAYLVLLRA